MTIKLNRKSLLEFLQTENERIKDLLLTFNVPNSVEDENLCDEYLIQSKKTKSTPILSKNPAHEIDDLEERLNTIRNKIKQKKRPMSERTKQKREAKKLKNNKKLKKVLVSVATSMRNNAENLKNDDVKPNKIDIKTAPTFNGESKIVFSKFDFGAHPGAKVKKSHQNPKEILKKINETNKKLATLKQQGEEEKAAELVNDLNWKKAFDKIEGKKVKDDPKLLVKAVKKRKIEKKKSKEQWVARKQKIETDIEQRQKKRNENINKRIKDKKNNKFKNLAKKGRIVPGF